MLGSPHDGERLNAARLLQRALDNEGVTFGDLALRIAHGTGGSSTRTVIVEKRVQPNPATDIARKILERTDDGRRCKLSERLFLRDILRACDMTDGSYELTTAQANWLTMLEKQYMKPRMPAHKARRAGPVPKAILDDLGLGDKPGRYKGHARATSPMHVSGREVDLDDEIPF